MYTYRLPYQDLAKHIRFDHLHKSLGLEVYYLKDLGGDAKLAKLDAAPREREAGSV